MSDATDELLQTLEEKLNRTMDNISDEGLDNIVRILKENQGDN